MKERGKVSNHVSMRRLTEVLNVCMLVLPIHARQNIRIYKKSEYLDACINIWCVCKYALYVNMYVWCIQCGPKRLLPVQRKRRGADDQWPTLIRLFLRALFHHRDDNGRQGLKADTKRREQTNVYTYIPCNRTIMNACIHSLAYIHPKQLKIPFAQTHLVSENAA